MQGREVSDEFLEYIINSGKTKLTADLLFEEFKLSGYYKKCVDSLTNDLESAVSNWDDEQWKVYIYNYAKLTLGIKSIFNGDKSLSKIIS